MIGRLIGVGLILSLTSAAAVQLTAALQAEPLIAFASTLESTEFPSPPVPGMVRRLQDEIASRRGCNLLLARSRVTASVYLLEHAGAEDVRQFPQRLLEVQEQVRSALACNPLDGNLWFVLGWVGYLQAPNQGLLLEHLLNAIRYGPSNGAALERRWRVLAPHMATLGFDQLPAIVGDLDTLYQYGNVTTIALVHDTLRRLGSTRLAESTLNKVSPERRPAIERRLELLTFEPRRREFLRFERRGGPNN